MTTPIALTATEFASYLAAVEAHPFASLLLSAVVIVFIRARRQPRFSRRDGSVDRVVDDQSHIGSRCCRYSVRRAERLVRRGNERRNGQ